MMMMMMIWICLLSTMVKTIKLNLGELNYYRFFCVTLVISFVCLYGDFLQIRIPWCFSALFRIQIASLKRYHFTRLPQTNSSPLKIDIKLGGGNSNIFYVHSYLGKIPMLTNIFQRGWNHQLENQWLEDDFLFEKPYFLVLWCAMLVSGNVYLYILYIIYIYISSGFSKPHPGMHFFYKRNINICCSLWHFQGGDVQHVLLRGKFLTTQPQPDIGNIIFHSPTGKGQNRYMPCNPCIGLYRRPVCDPPFGGWLAMVQRTMGPSPNPVSPRVDGVDQGANLARIRQQAGNLAARALTQKLLLGGLVVDFLGWLCMYVFVEKLSLKML